MLRCLRPNITTVEFAIMAPKRAYIIDPLQYTNSVERERERERRLLARSWLPHPVKHTVPARSAGYEAALMAKATQETPILTGPNKASIGLQK